MLHNKVEEALNLQVEREFFSSQLYLSMASWAETNGYEGSANFLYEQADEERMHALKLMHYINDREGHALVSALEKPEQSFKSIRDVFEQVLEHEKFVSQSINDLVAICIEQRDYTTQNFLQWYVTEQIEEESTARNILDKLNMLGDDKAKMYLFDRDVNNMRQTPPAE